MIGSTTSTVRMLITLALGLVQVGCCGDEPLTQLESGDYVINATQYVSESAIDPDKSWLFDSPLHVDRETETATLRYTREGTTYEVAFVIESP